MTMTPFLAATASYLLMLVAYFLPRHRLFHMPVMMATIVFDICMPFFLYTHRDWWHRLIEQNDIVSFLVWMHFGLLIFFYDFDSSEIYTIRLLLQGDETARLNHHAQGRALLVVRGLAIVTGGFLGTDPS